MATYTNSDAVKKRLRSASGAKVIFSDDGLESIAPKTGDRKGTINLDMVLAPDLILISDEFEGKANYRVEFQDDTNYLVYAAGSENNKDNRDILIGSGDINSDFTTSDGNMTISAGTFGGTITADDWVVIKLRADLSIDTVNVYIEDVEAYIDSCLEEWGIGYADDAYSTIYTTDVPRDIRQAATFLAVYYIYTSVLVSFAKDDAQDKYSTINRFKKRGEESLKRHIKIVGKHAPSVVSFPPFISQVGIPDVGVGMTDQLDSAKGEFEDWDGHSDKIYHQETTPSQERVGGSYGQDKI